MTDAVIVLNAGSSSLKFSIHRVLGAQMSLEVRGQIEGVSTTPRFVAIASVRKLDGLMRKT